MDIEVIQKINNLAIDLMRKGLATDREDAVRQAEAIYKDKDSSNYTSIRETIEDMQKSPEKKKEEDIPQEKIKEILEQNTQFMVKKIKEFQDKLQALESEVNNLKSRPVQAQMVSNPSNSTITKSNPEQRGSFQQEQKSSSSSSSSHPRSGNYNDNDVSIEKFFYMGSR